MCSCSKGMQRLDRPASSFISVSYTHLTVGQAHPHFLPEQLDMAGNVGTQSLAVTIRVLVDENLTTAKKLQLLWKEMRCV